MIHIIFIPTARTETAVLRKASLFKKFALCLAFQAVALPAFAQDHAKPAEPPEPKRSSRYASIVIDAQDGQALYTRNADRQLRPASTTKVMTAYLTFEALRAGTLRLDQELTVSRHAAAQERTNLAMMRTRTYTDKAGKRRTETRQVVQTITVENALKGMLVHSANDAAIVLAEAIGGSVEGFAGKMNRTATRLDMKNSHFMNPNGLPHTQQYTTVSDMAKLSAAVVRDFPEYYHFFNNRTFTYNGTTYRNFNNMLGSYDGADGLKTGYIHTSGFNLTASALRDGRRVIGVVFGADNAAQRKADMTILLDYGFAVLANKPRPAPPQNDTLPAAVPRAPVLRPDQLPAAAQPTGYLLKLSPVFHATQSCTFTAPTFFTSTYPLHQPPELPAPKREPAYIPRPPGWGSRGREG